MSQFPHPTPWLDDHAFPRFTDLIPHMVWVAGADGKTVHHNRQCLEYIGLRPGETHGDRWEGIVHPDDLPAVRASWAESVLTGGPFETEYRLRRHDGEYRWHLSRAARTPGADGYPAQWVGTCTDIDDRKRAELALAEREERFRLLAKATGDAVWDWDLSADRLWWGDGLLPLFGYDPADTDPALGWWTDRVHPDDRARTLANLDRAMSGGPTYSTEYRFRRADGSYAYVLSRGYLVRNEAGRAVRMVGAMQDFTDRMRAEAELRRTVELLRAVTEGTTDAVFVKDRAGKYLMANEAAARFMGYPVADVLGKDDAELFGPADAQVIADHDRAVMASGRVNTSEEELTSAGATRVYLATKAPYRDGDRAVIGVVGISRDITDRVRIERQLRLQDKAIRAVSQGILITDPNRPDNPIVYASPGFERITGYPEAEAVGRNCRFLQGEATDPVAVATLREAVRSGQACSVELLNYKKDGTPFWNALDIVPFRDGDHMTGFVGVQVDVTARRALEEQLRQAQKLEAVGHLAGGVAHDFNNLLTVINGYTDLMLADAPADEFVRESLVETQRAGKRAAELTRQLLALGRRQVLAFRILDLNEVVRGTERMLRRVLGEDIRLVADLAPDLGNVMADPGQMEQVLMNLVVNARHAMPTGGTLTIATRNVPPDDGPAGPPRGKSVELAVTDTGTGMTDEVRARLFEPFFTTKGPGQGTGLGLAVVHGIVAQSGGRILVESQPGQGTTFRILLPVTEEPAEDDEPTPDHKAADRGTETVLVVEDENGVRALTARILRTAGYTVLEAADGLEAVKVAADHPGGIDLVVTDVVMPGGSGSEVAGRLTAARPGLRVLYVSGYADDAVVRHGVAADRVNFLAKPFTPAALATKVRAVLDAGR